VESNGRLLTVIRYVQHAETVMIEVHALEPDDSWARVKRIVGQALFVGDACAGSFPAGATADDVIGENHVCFVDDEMEISNELDNRNPPAEAYRLRGRLEDVYRSVFMKVDRYLDRRCLRTVEAYIMSDRCVNTYRPGDSSARTGRWQLETVEDFPRSIPFGRGLGGGEEEAVVI
jgi:hypothetical protein